MKPIIAAMFSVVLFAAPRALAGEVFAVEDGFNGSDNVPASIANDIGRTSDVSCFIDSETAIRDALEARRINLGDRKQALLVKPKLPSEDKAAWGCFCGAYSCPMWLYSLDGPGTQRIWYSVGSSVEVVDRKYNGWKRLLVSNGTAGHQEAVLYGWVSTRFEVMRSKAIILGQSAQEDQRAENDMAEFLKDVTH